MSKEIIYSLKKGFKAPFDSLRLSLFTLLISLISLILMALSSSIIYSYQMFSYGAYYWLPAVQTRLLGLYIEGGILSLSTSLIYSLLIGITVSNFVIEFRNSGLNLRNLSGIGPGFLAAGCAGCGVGILSIIGFTGAIALLPFNGQLLRIGGMMLLIYFIAKTGDPRTCSISSS